MKNAVLDPESLIFASKKNVWIWWYRSVKKDLPEITY